jgi:hypothetical protein
VETVVVNLVRFTLRDDGILEIEPQPGVMTTAESVPDQIAAVLRMIKGTPRPVLWKPHGRPFTDIGAWHQWMDVATSVAIAMGIMHDEESDGPLPPFAAAADSLLFPVETFVDEAEAVRWLCSFIKPPD